MKKSIPLWLCICLLPFANVALAQSVAQSGYMSGDFSAFHGNGNTLVNAVAMVEQATGGKVIDIRFSSSNGMPAYDAVVVKGTQIQFFHAEERSKHVVELDASSKPAYMLNWRGKSDVHFAQTASVSLSAAIKTAEDSQNGSPAMAAGIARSASNPESDVHAYNVLLNRAGNLKRVSVDSSTGQVISDPSALSGF